MGKILSTTGSMASTLGAHNPLRYRGYVYDTETELHYLQSRYYDSDLGRFINADALVSTGQGLLGNNMFAYCNNNPVNCIDSSGTKSKFWYQLLQDHDPGYIHRAVQAHIIAQYNVGAILFSKEYVMPGIGRADIVCLATGEMWEIKHGGSTIESKALRTSEALAQLTRYANSGASLRPGQAGQFSGEFVINYDNVSYLVCYTTPEAGVVLYTLTRLESTEKNPAFVYATEDSVSTVTQALIASACLTFAYGLVDRSGGFNFFVQDCFA